jgi:nitrilase
MPRLMCVAAAHVAPVFMDAMASANKAASWIKEAGRQGIDILVFPEVFLPGFPYWINLYPPLIQSDVNTAYQDQSIEINGPELAVVREAAREAGVMTVIGLSERRQGGRTCYNTTAFIEKDGALLGTHRKLKPTYAERYVWGEGDGSSLRVFTANAAKIGALACWEHTMNLARQALIEQDEEIHAALWPSLSTMPGFDRLANIQIEAMMRNHALNGQCFVISASSPVSQSMLAYLDESLGAQTLLTAGGGWSAIIHPFSDIVAGPVTGEEEQLVVATIELDDLKTVKMWVDTTGHYSRPDVLRLIHDRSARTNLGSRMVLFGDET